jgi:signal transduction histidine kinase
MSSPSRSLIHYGYASTSDMIWSKSEKAIARQAFDAALKRELHELMPEWYIEGFAKRTGVNVKLNIATAQERLPIGIEIALFRVLQESLTNVHRHSGASEVSVCFQHQLEKIVLEIRDDGCGIPAERLDRLRETSTETGVGPGKNSGRTFLVVPSPS